MSTDYTQKPKTTLLFVDDEPLILQSLEVLFRQQYNVLTCSDPRQALDIIRQEKVSVIVSDQRMPGLTGVELLREVKDISPYTIRILLTGYSDLQAIIDSVNVGEIFRYINKPWRINKLRETIQFAAKVANERAWLITQKISFQKDKHMMLQSAAQTKKEILFLDQNQKHLQVYKDFFSNKYFVHIAHNAEHAFRIVNEKSICVLSSDVRSHNECTSDFLIAVKEKFPNMVLVLITDVRDANLTIKLINEGHIYRYLIKPFPKESLRLTIDSAALHHHVISENPSANLKIQEQLNYNRSSFDQNIRNYQELINSVKDNFSKRTIY